MRDFAYERAANKRRTPNPNIAIDPALLGTQDGTVMGSQGFGGSHEGGIGQSDSHRVRSRLPGVLPTSQEDMRIRRRPFFHGHTSSVPQPLDESPPQSLSGYPDAGLIDRGGLRDRFLQLYPVPEFQAPPILPEAQSGVDKLAQKETEKRVTRSFKKRTSADAGLSAEAEDNSGDGTFESRRSTRRSKRTKTSPTYNDSGDEGEPKRIRKISKLQAKIAAGKAPKKGSLGPNGEVRFREDGQMEFRDVNNPKWSKQIHSQHIQNKADKSKRWLHITTVIVGNFLMKLLRTVNLVRYRLTPTQSVRLIILDLTPDRGEAADDETSYESEQQKWGRSREDWKTIINSEGRRVMFEVDKPTSRRPPQEPSNWVHNGLVLLDGKNHPVKDWPGLNKTLSTEIESWRWEALMRMYPWLTVAE